jgi:hypothetical protein
MLRFRYERNPLFCKCSSRQPPYYHHPVWSIRTPVDCRNADRPIHAPPPIFLAATPRRITQPPGLRLIVEKPTFQTPETAQRWRVGAEHSRRWPPASPRRATASPPPRSTARQSNKLAARPSASAQAESTAGSGTPQMTVSALQRTCQPLLARERPCWRGRCSTPRQ